MKTRIICLFIISMISFFAPLFVAITPHPGSERITIANKLRAISSIEYSPDYPAYGSCLAVLAAGGCRIWHNQTIQTHTSAKPIKPWLVTPGSFVSIAWNPCKPQLALGGSDGQITLVTLPENKQKLLTTSFSLYEELPPDIVPTVYNVGWSSDGQILFACFEKKNTQQKLLL